MSPEWCSASALRSLRFSLIRLGSHIPTPGIDVEVGPVSRIILAAVFSRLGDCDRRFSPLALGIIPYFTAAILIQIAIFMMRRGARLRGARGARPRATEAVHASADGRARGRSVLRRCDRDRECAASSWRAGCRCSSSPTVATLCGGVLFLVWLAEQITTRGIGNGVALILFAAVMADIPQQFAVFIEA